MTGIIFKSDMEIELIDKMGSDETVARAARVSTGKDRLEQGKIEGLIKYLIREGHTSTLEHCTLTVRVHAPVFVMRQIYTHRTLAKNSESGRYKELEPVFYVPSEGRPLVNAGSGAHPNLVHGEFENGRNTFAVNCHKQATFRCWQEYENMLNAGIATEVARNVLPVGIYTSAYLTGNLLAWFNFLRLRDGLDGHPQWEIQEVAKKVASIIQEHYPLSYAAFEATRPER